MASARFSSFSSSKSFRRLNFFAALIIRTFSSRVFLPLTVARGGAGGGAGGSWGGTAGWGGVGIDIWAGIGIWGGTGRERERERGKPYRIVGNCFSNNESQQCFDRCSYLANSDNQGASLRFLLSVLSVLSVLLVLLAVSGFPSTHTHIYT